MFIEIVSHCYSVRMPEYAHYLNYQLSSLILDCPKYCDVISCVCVDENDSYTIEYVQWFMKHTSLSIRLILLSSEQMSWRAIGRNQAAITTDADIVWFTDCDYFFRDGVLDKLAEYPWPFSGCIIFPRTVRVGSAISEIKHPCIKDIDLDNYKSKEYFRPTGGVQITQGETIREYGYLKDYIKYQNPKGNPFDKCCDDDVRFRAVIQKLTEKEAVRIELPGVYRIMHRRNGRNIQ